MIIGEERLRVQGLGGSGFRVYGLFCLLLVGGGGLGGLAAPWLKKGSGA